jgi:hypothetical protein
MTKHSDICHVTYFDLIIRQNKYNRLIDTACLVTTLTAMIVVKCELYQSTVNKQLARKLNISFHKYTQNFCSEKVRIPEVEINCVHYVDNIITEL